MPEKPLIPVAGPSITEAEIAAVTEAARTGWYEGAGAQQRRFEQAFAAHLGRRHALSLPSCTSGLHLALAAAGVGPGDEVIVPELTWIATAAPIRYLGAEPVFADVDAATLCLSAEAVEAAINPRTKAIISVDLYGNMPDYAALEALADRHELALIEDAAQAIGSRWRGRPAGGFGLAACFSFHGTKTLTTGEGGMLVTDSDELRERVLVLRDHGRQPGDVTFTNAEVGFKYKMSGLQAALGLAQLERVDELVAGKRRLHARYREGLAELAGLRLSEPGPGVEDSHWMTLALVDPALGLDKLALMDRLRERGVDSRPLFHPLSALPAFADAPSAAGARARNPRAYAAAPWGINLPSALRLSEAEVDRVCAALIEILAEGPCPP